jgi:hypothetical protein
VRFPGARQRAYLSDLLTSILHINIGADIPAHSEHGFDVSGNAGAVNLNETAPDPETRIECTCYSGNAKCAIEVQRSRNSSSHLNYDVALRDPRDFYLHFIHSTNSNRLCLDSAIKISPKLLSLAIQSDHYAMKNSTPDWAESAVPTSHKPYLP